MKAAPVERTVRNGSLFIHVRRFADGRFGFDYTPAGGERAKVRKRELSDAVTEAETLLNTGSAGSCNALNIDRDEFAEFLRWKASRMASRSVPELVESFLKGKENKGRSYQHLRDLRGALRLFAAEFSGSISELKRADVERWLDARNVGPRRWNNLLSIICALHKFARRQGALPVELTPVETIDRKRVHVEVGTFTPEELRKLLSSVSHEWIPAIVFGAFAGIRPEEVGPDPRSKKAALQWENVLWAKGKIDVPANVSKTGRRRFAPLLPVAAAWLAPWRSAQGRVIQRDYMSKWTAQWARAAGIQWKPDGLRHSYASYRLAITQDLPALALEMGNSQHMLHTHYLDLKHEDEAREWFGIMPEEKGNVVAFA